MALFLILNTLRSYLNPSLLLKPIGELLELTGPLIWGYPAHFLLLV